MDEVELAGGVANAGAVVRVGPHVLRPSNPNSASIHRFLSALRSAGFDGASEPVDGVAVGLLDFDFAAPGRPVHDVAQFARMCVPIDDDANAVRFGWTPDELRAAPGRVRLVCDAYGLGAEERHELVEIVSAGMALVGRFVRRRMEAGDPNFTKMWHDLGGAERYERRQRWWIEHRPDFEAALA